MWWRKLCQYTGQVLYLAKKWIMRGCKVAPEQINHMAAELGISVMEARLLAVRGLVEAEDVRAFFEPMPERLHSPGLLRDMEETCRILWRAVGAGQKIVIYGDYDVDGVTATSIMMLALRRLGADVLHLQALNGGIDLAETYKSDLFFHKPCSFAFLFIIAFVFFYIKRNANEKVSKCWDNACAFGN